MKRLSRLSAAAGQYNWRRGQVLAMISLCRFLSYENRDEIERLLKDELDVMLLDYESEMRRLRGLHGKR